MATTNLNESTVQDVSHLAADSMWATNQHGGNRPSDQSVAMSAKGSPSPSVDEADEAAQPFVQLTEADPRATVTDRGDGPSHLGDGAVRTWQAIRRGQ